MMYPSSKEGKYDDVIRENGAIDTDALLFLDGNGMDTNTMEI